MLALIGAALLALPAQASMFKGEALASICEGGYDEAFVRLLTSIPTKAREANGA